MCWLFVQVIFHRQVNVSLLYILSFILTPTANAQIDHSNWNFHQNNRRKKKKKKRIGEKYKLQYTYWSDPKPWSYWWVKVAFVGNSYTILYRCEFYPLHERGYIWQITFIFFFEKWCIMNDHVILIPCYSYLRKDYLECLLGTFLFTDLLWEIPSRPTSISGALSSFFIA